MLLVGTAVWGLLIWQLSAEWRLNPQYSFGWGVPILGSYLAYLRWRNRPLAEPGGGSASVFVIGCLLLVWLPVRVAREANMDWRLLQWAMAGGVVLMTLLALHHAGGRRWVRHFGPVFLLIFLAVPWPTRLESAVVQGLTGIVTVATAEVLQWGGVAAWPAGNLIQIPTGPVGVDEACSGIRSLQGSVMAAVFFGELLCLTRIRRLFLVGLGVGVAVGLNIARTLALTYAALRSGASGVEAAHDWAGLAVLVLAFAVLGIAAKKLAHSREEPIRIKIDGYRGLPVRFAAGVAIWLFLVEGANELWFRSRTDDRTYAFMEARFDQTHFISESLPERTRSILRFDEGEFCRGRSDDGTRWWVYHLKWREGSPGTPLARYHSPEVCLPLAGLQLVKTSTLTDAGNLRFRSYEFDWLGKPLYVFFTLRGGDEAIARLDEFDLTWEKRLNAAWSRKRPGAQEILEVAILGAKDLNHARGEFEQFMQRHVRL